MNVSIKIQTQGTLDQVFNKVAEALKVQEFGVEFALAEPILSILADAQLQEFAKGVDRKIKTAAQSIQ